MSALLEAWRAFRRSMEAAGGPRFQPVDAAGLAALQRAFDCPPWLRELLADGYPGAAIRVGRREFFPPLSALTAFRSEDPAWPRAWLPIEVADGHTIGFVRGDGPAARALYEFTYEGDPGAYDAATPVRAWEDLAALLAAIAAVSAEARGRGAEPASVRGLPPAGVARLDAVLGGAGARAALAYFGVPTSADVAADLHRRRRTSLAVMTASAVLLAFAASLVFAPGGRGWAFALAVGVVPAAIFAASVRAWRRAREDLRAHAAA